MRLLAIAAIAALRSPPAAPKRPRPRTPPTETPGASSAGRRQRHHRRRLEHAAHRHDARRSHRRCRRHAQRRTLSAAPIRQACDLFHPAHAPEGMLVMIQQDVLTSIIAAQQHRRSKPIAASASATRRAAIKAAYGASARVRTAQVCRWRANTSRSGPTLARPAQRNTDTRPRPRRTRRPLRNQRRRRRHRRPRRRAEHSECRGVFVASSRVDDGRRLGIDVVSEDLTCRNADARIPSRLHDVSRRRSR